MLQLNGFISDDMRSQKPQIVKTVGVILFRFSTLIYEFRSEGERSQKPK